MPAALAASTVNVYIGIYTAGNNEEYYFEKLRGGGTASTLNNWPIPTDELLQSSRFYYL